MDAVMAKLSQAGELVDITVADPPMEEVIANIYERAREVQDK